MTAWLGLYPHQHKVTSNDPPLPAGDPAPVSLLDYAGFRYQADLTANFLLPR